MFAQCVVANFSLQIVGLNNAVEHVKLEQQQLDNELDFILAQQRELEESLAPLEKELGSSGVADPDREHM
jgi:nuclear pore complex protein Nup62